MNKDNFVCLLKIIRKMAIHQLKNPSTVFRTINTTSFDSGSLPFLSALLATWRRVRMKVYSISGWTNWCTVAWDRWTQSHRRTEYRARPWTAIYLRCWDGGKHIMSTTCLVDVEVLASFGTQPKSLRLQVLPFSCSCWSMAEESH